MGPPPHSGGNTMKDSLTITVSQKEGDSWSAVWKLQRDNKLYGNAIQSPPVRAGTADTDGFPLDYICFSIVENFWDSLHKIRGEKTQSERTQKLIESIKLIVGYKNV